MNKLEATRIVRVLTQKDWRIRQLGGNAWRAYPPNGRGSAVDFALSRQPRALDGVYARFRRAGVELDPARLSVTNERLPRRVMHPCTNEPTPLAKLIKQEPLPKDFGALDINSVRWNDHADQRLAERGISIHEVYAALAFPQLIYDGAHKGRKRLIRGDIEVIWEPDRNMVVTVGDRLDGERTTPRVPLYYQPQPDKTEGEAMGQTTKKEPDYKPNITSIDGLADTVSAVLQFADMMFELQPGKPWHIGQLREMFLPSRQFNEDALLQQLRRRTGVDVTLEGNRPYRIVKPGDGTERDGKYMCIAVAEILKPEVTALPGMSVTATAVLQFCDRMFAEQPGKVWTLKDLKSTYLPSRQFKEHALDQAFRQRIGRPLPERAYKITRPPGHMFRDGRYICTPAPMPAPIAAPALPPVPAQDVPDEAPKIQEIAQAERRFARPQEPAEPPKPTNGVAVPRQRSGGEIAPVNGKLQLMVAKWADGAGPVTTTTSTNGHSYMETIDELLRANPGRPITVTYHEIDMGEPAGVWVV